MMLSIQDIQETRSYSALIAGASGTHQVWVYMCPCQIFQETLCPMSPLPPVLPPVQLSVSIYSTAVWKPELFFFFSELHEALKFEE